MNLRHANQCPLAYVGWWIGPPKGRGANGVIGLTATVDVHLFDERRLSLFTSNTEVVSFKGKQPFDADGHLLPTKRKQHTVTKAGD
jgi:hypothetical protein